MSAAKLHVVSNDEPEPDGDGDLRGTPINKRRGAQLRAVLQELIRIGCEKGMTATLTLQWKTQDGTIQVIEDDVNRRYNLD